jgi:dipeptidyl aminopeptidase/acylaminoacyl peptidase
MLANRGYLVMQVNYRGSGGFGEQFEKSGYRLWGTTMQDDITDATLWAVEEGLADRERLCIYGGSYGGYATLMGITREPDLYRCGFAYVGVYDLRLMKKSGDIARRKSGQEYLDEALGSDEADLIARSPVTHVSKIKAALYVAHGKKDDRADVKNYYALTKALDEAEIPYKSLLTDKEAHGFWDLSNKEKLYGEMLTFFEENIGH